MIIGITGSLGTGKSTVAGMLAKKGARVLDADRIGHDALKKGSATYKRIVSCLGRDILNSDRTINRKKLAKIVFNNKSMLRKLTGIIHPFVISRITGRLKQAEPGDVVIVDAPLLVEAKLTGVLDKLVVVKAKQDVQLKRCVKGKKIKREEALSRIRNQMPLRKKIKIADYVIDNNGTLAETRKQVEKIRRELKWI